MDQRMIIISLDAVGSRDLAYMKGLPNFKRLRDMSAKCDHVESVYPSITYPAHTSIVTGNMPGKHGVINNILLQPEREKPDWMWQRRFVRQTTLYDEAMKAGYKTAALLWPVTANSKIPYCIPEIFPNRKWQNQIIVSALSGPIPYQILMWKKFGHLMKGLEQPQLDNFVTAAAEYTLRAYKPELFLIHLTDVDTNRHHYGLDGKQIQDAMDRHDKRLGRFLKVLEETGDMDKTTIVILGDHCQLDTHTVVYPNYYLKKAGFIREKNGVITDYDFIAQHCDGCCYIYASPKMKKEMFSMPKEQRTRLMQKLRSALKEIPGQAVHRIVTRREAQKRGADPTCICMLEANPGYFFQNQSKHALQSVNDPQLDGSRMLATHGYLPYLADYGTFFLMSGYGVKAGASCEKMHLWDEGPTLAKILGVSLGQTDGECKEELLDI